MAYAALVSLRQTTEKIIRNPDHYSIAVHHIDRIRSIDERIAVLQEFAADKFILEANSLAWRISCVAYDAQVVLERFISKQSRSCSGLNMYICVSLFRRRAKFHLQLERIREVFDSIAGELMEMEANGQRINDELQLSNSPATDSSSVIDVAGLDDDSVAIKTRLCGESPKLQVIAIVGMGGIGKTTLSRNVYNDPLTIQYFDVRAWVTVSQDYSTRKIVSSLVDSVKEFVVRKSGQSDDETVYKSLKGRRYLIVVDDMWSTDAWDYLRDLFPNDNNGSRIVLTTRMCDVAAYAANGSPLHEMCFLSDQQSWELLRQKVFADQDCSPQLENIGWKIAEGCRGVPLAISVIAGLLSMIEKNSILWREIADNVSSVIVTEDGQINGVLSLSYTHLPHHLQSCLLYMGAFPEDYEIRVSKLVGLWVAEGFLRCSEGTSKSLEDEAEECLEDLVSRSLVLVTERKYNGRIKSCGLHDLIRDLCMRKAKENNFFVSIMDRYVEKKHFIDSIKYQNRISIMSSSLMYLSSSYCSTIQTIMCFRIPSWEFPPIELDFLKSVILLRVLYAEDVRAKSLPDELFRLFHLRYLAISSMCASTIPAAISKLQNLQTLIIKPNRWELTGRPNAGCLPQEIWKLRQLRHLICYGRFPYPKETTATLENLERLSLVMHDMCVEGILEKIPNLKNLGVDCSYYDYGTHLNNLEHLHQLESLELRCADWRRDSISFPIMLRKLSLCNMSLPWSEMSLVGSLPNLEVLKLRDFACIGSTWETSEGEFPQLQYLLIETSKLQYWISEEYHFPRLRFLLLHECWYMNEIPEGVGEIATLELIDIRGHTHQVSDSLVESAKRIQEEQQSFGNDSLQVNYPLPND